MTKKSMLKIALASLWLLLICSVGSFAQQTNCSDMTDDEIVSAIREEIKGAYGDSLADLNISIQDKVLTLEGYVPTKKVKKQIGNYAKKYKKQKCISKAVNRLVVGVDCSKLTEAEIVNAIYDGIEKKYKDQMDHINLRYKDGVLTLEGWVTTDKVRKQIEKYAKKYIKKTKCNIRIDNKLTVGVGGGCGPGQKQCGSICIGLSEKCNVRGE